MSSGAPLPGRGEPGEPTSGGHGEILTVRGAATACDIDAAELERVAESLHIPERM